MKDRALAYLRSALDTTQAHFRDGQWECIEALLRCERLPGDSRFREKEINENTLVFHE